MGIFKQRATFFALCSIVIFPSLAISQASLRGAVRDSVNNEPVIGVNIIVLGTSLGAATDIEGEYKVSGIPQRPMSVKVSCVGYEPKQVDVDFTSKETVMLNVKLSPAVIRGEEVVITAQRRGQVAAINQQVTSKSIINVVSEEKIKELPDANAAEAIGRLPGVSLVRSGGEATKVVLRGLSSKFSNITVDGVKIPATDSYSRDVDLSTVSQGSLAGIELYKAITSDQDGDAIAGAVNLVTKRAPLEREISVDAKGNYNRLMSSLHQYDLSVRYGERFFDGWLGLQLQGNVERKIRSKENTTTRYRDTKSAAIDPNSSLYDVHNITSFTVDFTDENRFRKGAQAIIDFTTPDSGIIKISGMLSQTDRDILLHNRVYPAGAGSSASWDYNYRNRELTVGTINASIQGINHLMDLDLKWGASYAQSALGNPYDFALKFTDPNGAKTGGVPSGPDHPELYVIPYATNDFSSAACSTGVFYHQANFDKEQTVHFDAAYNYSVLENLSGEIKTGAKYKNRARWMTNEEYDDNTYLHGFSTINVNTSYMMTTRFADYLANRSGSRPSLMDFVNLPISSRQLLGMYEMIPLIDRNALKVWYDLTKDAVVNGEQQYLSNAMVELDEYSVREQVTSMYLMNTLNFGQEAVLITGMRVEREVDDYIGKYSVGGISNIGIRYSATNGVNDNVSQHDETVLLPNAQLSIRPTDFLTLRFAGYKALARPDYNSRLPQLFLFGTELTIGNPDLKDAVAWNYEVNTQVYNSTIGLISLSVFYKEIENLHHQMTDVQIDSGLDSLLGSMGITWQRKEPFRSVVYGAAKREVTVAYNSSKPSYAWGVEFEHQLNLGFLPGYLQNLVLSYNLSVTRSKTTILGNQTLYKVDSTVNRFGVWTVTKTPYNVTKEYERDSEGQPRFYGNISLGYDIAGLSARLSVFFQDEYVESYSQDGQKDSYVVDFNKWDLSLKQVVTDNVALFLNVNNITNRAERKSYHDTIIPWTADRNAELYGTTVDFGVRVTL